MNAKRIYFCAKCTTTLHVSLGVTKAMSQPVRCSTWINKKRFQAAVRLNVLGKSRGKLARKPDTSCLNPLLYIAWPFDFGSSSHDEAYEEASALQQRQN